MKIIYTEQPFPIHEEAIKELIESLRVHNDTRDAASAFEHNLVDAIGDNSYHLEYEDNGCDINIVHSRGTVVAKLIQELLNLA